jgi:hypothetical protein
MLAPGLGSAFDHELIERIVLVQTRGVCEGVHIRSRSTNMSPRTALRCSRKLAGLAPRASFRRRSMARINPARAASGSRSAIQTVSRYSASAARIGTSDQRALAGFGVITPRPRGQVAPHERKVQERQLMYEDRTNRRATMLLPIWSESDPKATFKAPRALRR